MEDRLRIAVFIDFDNIEIGVKNTLGRDFEVSPVLEALKERGEVLTKIAYADWTRQGTLSRSMTQHAVQMVQRHPGPRGDKNGADINLALDALEMALTKPHIDAFAIVSGDSDFIPLVEKLKQYNKAVFIVGGRAFTSTILQKNCREFISYESLLSSGSSGRGRGSQRASKVSPALPLPNVAPLVTRALEVLTRREVQPQLGLLKSTMLQLDSSFTERDYGTSSFRHFVEMLNKARIVEAKRVGGQYLVELPQQEQAAEEASPALLKREDALPTLYKALKVIAENGLWGKLGFGDVRHYVARLEPDFEESRYGFGQFAELLNYAQDVGMIRLEPDAQSVLRVFPGAQFTPTGDSIPAAIEVPTLSAAHTAGETMDASSEASADSPAEPAEAAPPKRKRPYRRRSRKTAGRTRQPRKAPSAES
ncbi:MAG: NYN domain-containing protein [Acidobacteria bacterium]|nr:NYN domain-containing protein [Acidobacteriota bacterium]